MNIAYVLCGLALLWLFQQIRHLHKWTVGTTANACRQWACVATTICWVAVLGRITWFGIPVQWQSAAQYLAAVMLLSPVIAVLGARRPGARAWPWFVVLTMILVLQWPSFSELLAGSVNSAVQIPAPTFAGFVLVLIMGFGNYFGTINTLAAVFGGTAVLLIGLPVSEMMPFENAWSLPTGCALLVFSVTLLPGRYFEPPETVTSDASPAECVNQLWADFRDLYGIVWAKRVMDRVNQFAARERWNVVLSLDGFVSHSTTTAPEFVHVAPDSRPVQVLCWVLRRFVDPVFFQRYLPETCVPHTENTD